MGGVTFIANFRQNGGVAHQPLLVSEIYGDCLVVWYQNIRRALFGFVANHECQTDRQTNGKTDTDRQNYDFQDRASIAARTI